ncbi:hypothetical protein psal_cds_937 [Pandoravirus salinus]|uniref:Uncharacterized protein n=1 Tax=Pandoravirus salinus TaxID=1349410 RepID=S4W439_9VIRU|nr:hypothetical protein psal_cds_937 [Pandoravirus salinus]AGO85080.2 hypothetical protein psal_cds_937 [Pandoravirus salinus]
MLSLFRARARTHARAPSSHDQRNVIRNRGKEHTPTVNRQRKKNTHTQDNTMNQRDMYNSAVGLGTPFSVERVVIERRAQSPAAQWLSDNEDAGLFLTGDQLDDLDQSTAHIVVPIDAVASLDDPDSTGPSDHGLELVPFGSLGGKVLRHPAVTERLTDEADLGPDDRLYAGVVIYDRWTNKNQVTPWAAVGSPDQPVRGVYNGIPTRYVLLE